MDSVCVRKKQNCKKVYGMVVDSEAPNCGDYGAKTNRESSARIEMRLMIGNFLTKVLVDWYGRCGTFLLYHSWQNQENPNKFSLQRRYMNLCHNNNSNIEPYEFLSGFFLIY